tara:strand:- start:320 stop:688 length:369 start_codon:yes stop_codon:yes gene_type:complete
MAKVYWIEREALAVADTKDYKTYTSVTEAKTITLFCSSEDEEFHADTSHATKIGLAESPAFPAEFHEALAYKVIQQGYERKPEKIQIATYFSNAYEKMVIDAKKRANKEFDNSGYAIQGYDY